MEVSGFSGRGQLWYGDEESVLAGRRETDDRKPYPPRRKGDDSDSQVQRNASDD